MKRINQGKNTPISLQVYTLEACVFSSSFVKITENLTVDIAQHEVTRIIILYSIYKGGVLKMSAQT